MTNYREKSLFPKYEVVKDKLENLGSKKILIYLIVIAFILLLGIFVFRFLLGGALIPGQEGYYHLRISEDYGPSNLFQDKDDKSLGDSPLLYTVFNVLLAPLIPLGDVVIAIGLPIILGLLSIYVLNLNLLSFKQDIVVRTSFLGLFIVSPIFLKLYTHLALEGFAVLLLLLGVYLFFKKSTAIGNTLSYLFFIIFASLSLTHALIGIVILLLIFQYKKISFGKVLILIVLMLIMQVFLSIPSVISYEIVIDNFLKLVISDFGANYGFSLFSLVLAVIGFTYSWQKKSKFAPIYLSFFALIFLSIFLKVNISPYLLFFILFFVLYAIIRLSFRPWKLVFVKDLTILLIICSFLFSTISQAKLIIEEPPSAKVIGGLDVFEKLNIKKGNILSSAENAYWIQQRTKRAILTDFNSRDELVKEESNKLLHSRTIKPAAPILDKYNISYIVVTKDMIEGGIWNGENEGLLYLMTNIETFKKLYFNDEIAIYEHLRS